MFPPVSSSALHVVVLSGVFFLLVWWLFHFRSGLRGFGLVVVGSAIILIAGYGWGAVTALLRALQVSVLPVALAFVVLLLLAVSLIAVLNRSGAARRRMAHLLIPKETKCPSCKQQGYLHEYEVQGGRRGRMVQRLCNDCAARKNAKLVGI